MNRIFVLIFLLSSLFCFSQKDTVSIFSVLQNQTTNNSQVIISQNPSIRLLIDRDVHINRAIRGVENGYRIQIFSGYGHDARKKSQRVRVQFLTLFPNFDPVRVYSKYSPPFIKVRVGDYRNRHEALKDYRNIVKQFNDCYIVKTRINYPKIK